MNKAFLPQPTRRMHSSSSFIPLDKISLWISGVSTFWVAQMHFLNWCWPWGRAGRERKQKKGTWASHPTSTALHPKGHPSLIFWPGRWTSLGGFQPALSLDSPTWSPSAESQEIQETHSHFSCFKVLTSVAAFLLLVLCSHVSILV